MANKKTLKYLLEEKHKVEAEALMPLKWAIHNYDTITIDEFINEWNVRTLFNTAGMGKVKINRIAGVFDAEGLTLSY